MCWCVLPCAVRITEQHGCWCLCMSFGVCWCLLVSVGVFWCTSTSPFPRWLMSDGHDVPCSGRMHPICVIVQFLLHMVLWRAYAHASAACIPGTSGIWAFACPNRGILVLYPVLCEAVPVCSEYCSLQFTKCVHFCLPSYEKASTSSKPIQCPSLFFTLELYDV